MLRCPRPWQFKFIVIVAVALVFASCGSSTARVAVQTLPTPTAGLLVVSVDRSSYGPSEPIGVTVLNTSKQILYATDGRSGCTFVQLQQYDSSTGKWLSTVGCDQPYSPKVREIPAGLSEPFTIAPGNSPSNPNMWVPGIYRVGVEYGLQADGVGPQQVAFSAAFRIT